MAEITDRGRKVLTENPKMIDVHYLRQFPEFLTFLNSSNQEDDINPIVDISHGTPEEILEGAYSQLKNQVLAEIIEKIKLCTLNFLKT